MQARSERGDRIAAIVEIQQLAHRYALAVDSRDLDLLVSLFVPDVIVGQGATGWDALRSWYAPTLRAVGATIHLVANHTVDVDGETARGVVSCREEVEDILPEAFPTWSAFSTDRV